MDYWIPIILYYTGCRVEEIAQLHKRDIQQRDGVLCMKLQENETQSIKTGKTRYVPVPLHAKNLLPQSRDLTHRPQQKNLP